VLAVLLLLLVPLRSFTAPRPQVAQPLTVAVHDSVAHLEIVSTKAPFTFKVAHLGKTIWKGESAGDSTATDLKLPIPKQGIDLFVEIAWKSPGVSAAKLILTHDDDSVERSIWGDGNAADVLTFP
jgi:hypothetical protein